MAEKKQQPERGYLHRAYIRKSTREGIEKITDKKQWQFKQDPQNYTKEYSGKIRSDRLRDANTGKVINGKPDIGHKSGYEERVMRECAERMHMSQKDYNNMMNNPKLYHFEDRKSNRSHQYEETNRKAQVSKAMREINRYMDSKKQGQTHVDGNRSVHKNVEKQTHSRVGQKTTAAVHTTSGKNAQKGSAGHSSSSKSSGSAGHSSSLKSSGSAGHSSSSKGGGSSGHSSSGGKSGHSK